MTHLEPGVVEAQSARIATADAIRALIRFVARVPEQEATLFDQAVQEIRLNLTNPHLNAEFLADKLGVSLKLLQAEFRNHETTVPREVRRLRAHSVRQMRANNPDANVMMLARSVGFTSKSSLYRALAETEAEDGAVNTLEESA